MGVFIFSSREASLHHHATVVYDSLFSQCWWRNSEYCVTSPQHCLAFKCGRATVRLSVGMHNASYFVQVEDLAEDLIVTLFYALLAIRAVFFFFFPFFFSFPLFLFFIGLCHFHTV
eukprot:TRINITY_DN18617_c0_g1_i1.p1 TRINITY_DN18617_c0_g1~~TRINITY_DN18617_c0_g1_i1.p1  ORF type:complete len:116 (-),score=9.00 TRINITY_DN18617_c0_g1_i1:35-382(-)